MMEQETVYKLYSSVERKELSWLWYPYISYGKITLLQGDPGDGKSTFMMNVAAILSVGGVLPDGTKVEEPGNCIYQCSEDGLGDTIKPRLAAAGADCDRIAFIEDNGTPLSLLDNRIEEAIKKFHAKLVILDPIQSFIPQEGDIKSSSKMRSILQNISGIAEKYQCAVVMVGHMTKASGDKNLYRGLGSIDIVAVSRSVLMISRDENNPEVRYMFPVKSSLAPMGNAISFFFDSEKGFQWIGKCTLSSSDRSITVRPYAGKMEKAQEILRIMLSAGDLPSKEVLARMKKMGISEKTVRNAQKELGIVAYRKRNVWYWKWEQSNE